MRYLAVDLGDRRTGLAVGDDETKFVSPAGTIEIDRASRTDALIEAVHSAASEHEAGVIVLGLPLNMDGTEGGRAGIVRDFGDRLAARGGESIALRYQDERLTSYAAEQHLSRSGRTHGEKKRLRDQLAASEILKDFFRCL